MNMEVDTRPPASWKPNFGFGLKKLACAMGGGGSNAGSSGSAQCASASTMHCWQPVADTSVVAEAAPAATCGSTALLGCTPMAGSRQVAPLPPPRPYLGQPGCQGCATLQHRNEVEKAQLSAQLSEAESRSADLKQQAMSLQKQLDELKAFAAPLLAVNCVMGSLPSMCPGLLTDNKNCLGSGSYGTAHEWSLQTDSVVVKEIHLKKSSMENVAYEVGLTSLINHPNVVKSLGWWMGGRTPKQADASVEACVLLMMERCEGSLADCLDQGLFHHTDTLQPKDVKALLEFAHGVCNAVTHIHQLGIIHNDITVNNVFPKKCRDTGRMLAKLGDFGLSLPIPEGTYTGRSRGTPELSAPELLRDTRCACHSRASDVYSLGGTLWELFTCRPWRWLNNSNQFEINALYPHVPAAPAGLSELIVHMMAPNPSDRPTMEVVLARMAQLLQQPIVAARGPLLAAAPVPASVARPHRHHHHAPSADAYPAPKRTAPQAPGTGAKPAPTAGGHGGLPSKRAAAAAGVEDDVAPTGHHHDREKARDLGPTPVELAALAAGAPHMGVEHLSSDSSVHSGVDDVDSPMADAVDEDTPDFSLLCSQPSDASTGEYIAYHLHCQQDSGQEGNGRDRAYPQAHQKGHSQPQSHSRSHQHATAHQHASHPAAHPWMAHPAKLPAAGHPAAAARCGDSPSHSHLAHPNPSKLPRKDATSRQPASSMYRAPAGRGAVDLTASTHSTSSLLSLAAGEAAASSSGGHARADPVTDHGFDASPSEHRPEQHLDHSPVRGAGSQRAAPVPTTPTPQAGLSQFVNGSSSSDRSTNSSCPSRDMFTV